MIVVDASVACKWWFDEVDSQVARTLLRSGPQQLACPDLLLTEVAGAIVRAGNTRRMTFGAAQSLLGEWHALWSSQLMTTHRLTAAMSAQASDVALRLGHPFVDCIYLALAVELHCDLVTADRAFFAKAAGEFDRVRLLSTPM